jgi:carbamoylphosphate synthase small subunit
MLGQFCPLFTMPENRKMLVVMKQDMESKGVFCKGIVVRSYQARTIEFLEARRSLGDFAKEILGVLGNH